MLQRCGNQRNRYFHRYGGRGITVHPAWRESFEAFLRDVGERPSRLHTLDRIDNDRGYEPGNVRWATRLEQARNRSTTRLLEFAGQSLTLTEWGALLGVSGTTLAKRIDRGEPLERALTGKRARQPRRRAELRPDPVRR